MDNLEKPSRNAFVSPYLRGRLRSLEEAERARERARAHRRRAALLSERLDEMRPEPPIHIEAVLRP